MSKPVKYELIKVLADIIQTNLCIPAYPPSVFIYNQKTRLPKGDGMFIDIEFLGSKPFGVRRGYENSADQTLLLETLGQQVQETYQVRVWSQNGEARMRNHEILFALNSTYAQQQMEIYSFKLANLPSSFTDISGVEASAILNTYAIRFNALRKFDRCRPVAFFDKFVQPSKPILTDP